MSRKRLLKLSIATKLLVSFLLLLVVSFIVVGSIAILNMDDIGNFADDSSNDLGIRAARDSTSALEEQGELAIKQKAIDVAKQISIYLERYPDTDIYIIKADPELDKIAVQPVGLTGYTALYEKGSGMMRFHPNPELKDYDMHNLSEKLPSFWMVFQPSLRGTIFSGYYDWEDEDGSIRQKFMYMVPVEGTVYMVAATTYIDEFSQPVTVTKDRIAVATSETTEHINSQITDTRNVFIILFIVILFVAAGLVFWLSRMLTSPIKRLTMGSAVIGAGDLDYKVEVKSGDELEHLADSFNKMASDLKSYTEELRRTTAEKERMAKELEIAKGIQQNFLPESAPQVEGAEMAAINVPALEVGGDFYDFIPVGKDKWGLVIADVSGKGVPAALFMALSRTLVRAYAVGNPTVSEAILKTNNLIADDDRNSMFVTLFYGVLDTKNKTLTYVSAGHNPPLMLPGRGGDTIMLQAKGVALGIMPDIELEEKEISLEEGDVVTLYTDGVTEAINRENEQFGPERLATIVSNNHNLSTAEIVKKVEQEVTEFSQGQPQFDDITLLILKIE